MNRRKVYGTEKSDMDSGLHPVGIIYIKTRVHVNSEPRITQSQVD